MEAKLKPIGKPFKGVDYIGICNRYSLKLTGLPRATVYTDVPEQDDGSAASAMVDDCREYVMEGKRADWMNQ